MENQRPHFPTREFPSSFQSHDFLAPLRTEFSARIKQVPHLSFTGKNLLLEALLPEDREYLLASAKEVVLSQRKELHRPHESPDYGYFLTSGIASIVAVTERGEAAEVGMVGPEGLVGGFELLGPARASTLCVMQGAGRALRVPFHVLRNGFETRREMRASILEFVQQQALSYAQLAGCNQMHDAKARLARWLLMAQDRTDSDVLELTQEFLAEMLGLRRTTVTVVAGCFQRSGMIEYSRGKLKIASRAGLEATACRCYPILKALHVNLYPTTGLHA